MQGWQRAQGCCACEREVGGEIRLIDIANSSQKTFWCFKRHSRAGACGIWARNLQPFLGSKTGLCNPLCLFFPPQIALTKLQMDIGSLIACVFIDQDVMHRQPLGLAKIHTWSPCFTSSSNSHKRSCVIALFLCGLSFSTWTFAGCRTKTLCCALKLRTRAALWCYNFWDFPHLL